MSKMWKSTSWNWWNSHNRWRRIKIYESAKPEIRFCSMHRMRLLRILSQQWERQRLENCTWRVI